MSSGAASVGESRARVVDGQLPEPPAAPHANDAAVVQARRVREAAPDVDHARVRVRQRANEPRRRLVAAPGDEAREDAAEE